MCLDCFKLCLSFYDCGFGGRIATKITLFASFETTQRFEKNILKIGVM